MKDFAAHVNVVGKEKIGGMVSYVTRLVNSDPVDLEGVLLERHVSRQ